MEQATDGRTTRILLVEDEETIRDFVRLGLEYEGVEVDVSDSWRRALEQVRAFGPDLVVLDLLLPELDGLEVCRALRRTSSLPIIMLTARGEVDDRVLGLESGADDYLAKPFKFKELLARIRAVLRRSGADPGRTLKVGPLMLDTHTRQVTRDGRTVDLTPRELELLEQLMRHPRWVLSREQLLDRIWGMDYLGDANVVEVHVSALRAKLGDQERQLIRTVRGVGYLLSG
jgi:DNA-binding response OmpR family regulator